MRNRGDVYETLIGVKRGGQSSFHTLLLMLNKLDRGDGNEGSF